MEKKQMKEFMNVSTYLQLPYPSGADIRHPSFDISDPDTSGN